MARGAPRLVLFGPDTKNGARKKAGFKDYYWYIVHKRTEITTGHCLAERRDAELALAKYIRDGKPAIGKLTVAAAFKLYRESAPEKHTLARVEQAFVYVRPALGAEMCLALNRQKIERYYRDRLDQGAAPWTVWTELSRLRTAVKFALGAEYKPLWLPKKPEPAGTTLTRSQVARLLWACRRLRWEKSQRDMVLMILVALYCCQREEACTQLSWERRRGHGHIDLDTMRISFKRLGEAENKKPRADMPIPRPLRLFLKLARKRTTTWLFESNKKPGEHVIDMHNSWQPVREWASKPLMKANGDPWERADHPWHDPAPALAQFRFHDLIHTGATWRARSTPQHVLSKLINKTPATLSTVYLHAEQDELEEAALMSPGKRQRRI